MSDRGPGRNDLCPCGSGQKFKRCCMPRPEKPPAPPDLGKAYYEAYGIRLKQGKDVDGIRQAGRLVVATLDMVEQALRPGMTTDDINALIHQFTLDNGAKPATLNYRGFPKSCCTSVNEVICHGIPGPRVLKESDIINVDVTSILDGYFADANKTFFVGTPGPKARHLVATARRSLKQGLAMVKAGHTVGDIGWAIQQYAEGQGCSVVREYIGHGVGFSFHEPPDIPHFGRRNDGIELVPGMVFTVEPMINAGARYCDLLNDRWTVVTRDGSLSAQFEQTVLVTEEGYESLTPYDLAD
jgi:methionyl aminopeptidase